MKLSSNLLHLLQKPWINEAINEAIQIAYDNKDKKELRRDFVFRGTALEIQNTQSSEFIISGPAETGKTVATLHKLHCLMLDNPGAQSVIVRKRQVDMPGTCLQTFEKKVLPESIVEDGYIRIYGGSKPERYIYKNGSTIWIGGLDNPGKTLSSERDAIYVNQCEELNINDWETLTSRSTGRAGIIVPAPIFGDCNPSHSNHWILQRAKSGGLDLFNSYHKDNPLLFDDKGKLTPQGQISLDTLSKMTGMRRKRLLEGKWATAEGTVYDFDENVHVVNRKEKEFKYWGIGVDEGYTNPAVVLLVGIDGDGRLHVFQEFYKSGVLQSVVVDFTKKLYDKYRPSLIMVDSSAAGLIAAMRDSGVPARGHSGKILEGVSKIQEALKVAGDDKPRLTVSPVCKQTINEFTSYVWQSKKEAPVKENDHAMDALRYFVKTQFKYNRSGARGT